MRGRPWIDAGEGDGDAGEGDGDGDAAAELGVAEEVARLRLVEVVLELLLRIGRVQQRRHAASADHRQEHEHQFEGVGEGERHDVARADTKVAHERAAASSTSASRSPCVSSCSPRKDKARRDGKAAAAFFSSSVSVRACGGATASAIGGACLVALLLSRLLLLLLLLYSSWRNAQATQIRFGHHTRSTGAPPESSAHLIAGCAFAAGAWARLGIAITEDEVATLWCIQPPSGMPVAHFNVFMLLCCWRIWKHRHDVVFHSLPPCYNRLFAGCREDAELWSCRLPQADRHIAQHWASMFHSLTSSVTISNNM
ncbi:hypothetical protein EJB05_55173, partial [Eragrostis curvula]